jgi:hypothetical protein
MINPSELRIGNIYKPTDGNGDIAFVTVDDLRAWVSGAIYGKYIPLTEEWLAKAGFKKERVSSIGGQDMWAGLGAYSYKGEWLFRGDYRNLHLVSYFNSQYRYVHQVQNIFYMLYGKELTFTL